MKVGLRDYVAEKAEGQDAQDKLNNLEELVRASSRVDDKGGLVGRPLYGVEMMHEGCGVTGYGSIKGGGGGVGLTWSWGCRGLCGE